MSLSDSTSWVKVKERFDPDKDTCQTFQTKQTKKYEYQHTRPLPEDVRERSTKYIDVITAKFPFQMRHLMGLAYWKRFSESWCDYGDEQKAMRAI